MKSDLPPALTAGIRTLRKIILSASLLLISIAACAPAPPNPLVGQWTEEVQYACGTKAEVVPKEPLKELILENGGTFSVTWHPFESYVDYRGAYKTNGGAIEFLGDAKRFAPNAKLSGTFSFDEQSRLILSDLWLGGGPGRADAPACGHRFKKVK